MLKIYVSFIFIKNYNILGLYRNNSFLFIMKYTKIYIIKFSINKHNHGKVADVINNCYLFRYYTSVIASTHRINFLNK